MTGVQTNVVTSVDISGWEANDSPYFKPLVETTAQHCTIDDVSADKAYISHGNLAAVTKAGGRPYIPFKDNAAVPSSDDDSQWARTYHFFAFNRPTFLDHDHKRSNVESTYSMIKGKFGDAVRSKSDTGQVNEVLCKVLCHNICVLVQSIHELGIEPVFSSEPPHIQANRAGLACPPIRASL